MTFITALEEIEDPIQTSDGEIQPKKYETIEVNEQTAKTLLNGGRFAKRAWQCPKCGELHTDGHYDKKPPFCQNPNCNSKTLVALHPTEHHEIGNVLMDNYVFKTMDVNEEMYHYNGNSHFENDGTEALIKGKTKEILPDCKSHMQNEVVEHIKTSTFENKEKFGLPPEKLVVENGVLNLLERRIEKVDFEENIPITKIPVEHDPEADCPKIKSFLKEIVHEDDVKLIQEMFGYCLWKDYPIAKAFMLLGSGANGKSTLLQLLEEFLGQKNVAGPSLQKLLENRFARIELFGKLANIHADLPSESLEGTGAFKMLTGGDVIQGEKKYRDPIEFHNHAKLIYSANELPRTADKSEAFFRRWIIINFPNQFPEGDRETDPNLPYSIIDKREMSGLLNWALDGLERVLKNKRFSQTKPREEIEHEWIMQTDSLRAFLDVACETKTGAFVAKSDFYEVYRRFCDEKNIYAAKKGQVTKRLPVLEPTVDLFRPEIDGERVRCWRNLQLKESFITESYVQDVQPLRTSPIAEAKNEPNKQKSSSKTLDILDASTERQEVKRLLNDDLGRTPEDVADELDMDLDKVEAILKELYDQGWAKKRQGPDGSPLYARSGGDG